MKLSALGIKLYQGSNCTLNWPYKVCFFCPLLSASWRSYLHDPNFQIEKKNSLNDSGVLKIRITCNTEKPVSRHRIEFFGFFQICSTTQQRSVLNHCGQGSLDPDPNTSHTSYCSPPFDNVWIICLPCRNWRAFKGTGEAKGVSSMWCLRKKEKEYEKQKKKKGRHWHMFTLNKHFNRLPFS